MKVCALLVGESRTNSPLSHFSAVMRIVAWLSCVAAVTAEAQLVSDGGSLVLDGITTNLGAGTLTIGNNTGNTRLTLTNAASVIDGTGNIGFNGGSGANAVTVTDPGSLWTNRDDLYIGRSGPNNLLVITNGAMVVNSNGYVGRNTGADGNRIIVTGTGSVWTNASQLMLGYLSTGNQLNISDGGKVFDAQGLLGLQPGSINNSASVSGAGAEWNVQTFFSVGYQGRSSSLFITNGGTVHSDTANIGLTPSSSNNFVLVSGSGSIWSNTSSLHVGNNSRNNTIFVTNGGRVNDHNSAVGFDLSASNNLAVISDPGSLWFTDYNFFKVGDYGSGNTAIITNGGVASVYIGIVGSHSGAQNNRLIIAGANSSFTNIGYLDVGGQGSRNTLVVTNGGTVAGPYTFIGDLSGTSNNVVVVADPNSLIANDDLCVVGWHGSANTLLITNGGTVNNGFCYVGMYGDANNNLAVIAGTNSSWNGGGVYCGIDGSANSILVTNGGQLIATSQSYVGMYADSMSNSVVIAGAGSVWSNGWFLEFGSTGPANTLVITNGGKLSVGGNVYIGTNPTSTNNLVHIGSGGTLAIDPLSGGQINVVRGRLELLGNNSVLTPGIAVVGGSSLVFGADSSTVVGRVNDDAFLALDDGKLLTAGFSETLGQFFLSSDSTVDLGNGASVLRFAASDTATWTSGAKLSVLGWSGSRTGGGTDQLIFGTNNTALTAAQLASVQFINPDGLPPYVYEAWILSNGEVVPATPPPTLVCASNRTIACGTPWDFDPPLAGASCAGTNYSLVILSTTTNSICGHSFVATRTWQITDACSNSLACSQTITVADTTAPVITCASNRVVECGTAWTFDAPAVTDACDGTNVSIVITGTLTNSLCGNTFEATRTWLATDGCSNSATCSQRITIVDTTPPVLTCVSNRAVECGTAWNFDAPSASDVCDGTNVTVVITGTTTNALCGNTFSATRTWSATDSCSNNATCSQTITIVDTTPPSITCASNRVVECGDVWTFDAPTASDVCDGTNVTITIFSTITNQLIGQTFSATRTWQATDSCSNSATCSQTITLIDTTPPQIFCSSNILLECTGPAGTPAFFLTTASDVCDSNVTVVCVPPSGSLFALGTNTVVCTATDDSGNTNVCTFTVTVLDTTPPQIACPPNLIVSESPRDSGGATVTFAAPAASDICDSALQLLSSVPSGSVFTNGTSTVTWTATDASGNSNSCSFTIRVIPYRLFVVTNTDDSGPGSLRQALLDGNAAPDENLIIFQLPGAGPYTIHLLSALPTITSPTILDGWSISGSNNPPVVELDGGTNTFDGLVIRSGPSTVRGLALYGFANAIRLDSAGTNTIQGNFIGTDLTGTNAAGNTGHGILLTNQTARNLIGGTPPGTGNIIAFNAGNGVALDATAGSRNAILGNSIFANGRLGIDLRNDGVTPNDADDSDTGPNGLQNFPILSDARSAAGVTTIDGALTSLPSRTYRLEFFVNDAASTNGQAFEFLGAAPLTVHGGGPELFSVSFPVTLVYTQHITATATDPFGNTSEISPSVQVRTPPVIEVQPVSTNALDGSTVTFCASASGTPPIYYQWRLNGVNIPGATNPCYTVSASIANAGTYTVIVGNDLGAFATATASLVLSGGNILNLPVGDNFADAIDLSSYGSGTNGVVIGDNSLATFEPPFEPMHAGKPGGRSVWYRWCTPSGSKGVATFRTTGSTFDTLMGVYQGTTLSNLVQIISDEDDGGFYSSECRFNAFYNGDTNNSCYYIAIDGFGGVGGEFVLSWNEIKTSHMLPVILIPPASQTVPAGASITFSNLSVPECPNGHLNCNNTNHWFANDNQKEKLTYQWYFNDTPIPGETNRALSILSVQPGNVGNYRVRVSTPYQYSDSKTAVLQINDTDGGFENVQAFDKFIDVDFSGNPLFIGTFTENTPSSVASPIQPNASTAVVRGYTGTQIFNTTGSGTAPSETICGVLGGSSEWISFVAEANGTLFLNTDGSTYDTVMAVFSRSLTNLSQLNLLTCDNNSGTNGKTSSLTVPVNGGQTNYILVDGVGGATGILQLNYSLATATILKLTGRTPEGLNQIQVNGRAGLKFTLQGSLDMKSWTSLITATNSANGTFDFTDNTSTDLPNRFYRALVLP